jgi:GTP cyclohydrolase I
MFVKRDFGLNPDRKPKASTFENNYKYGEMLVEKNIHYTPPANTICYLGRAHVAYISNGRVIGLSKMNRIVILKNPCTRTINHANCVRSYNAH